MSSKDWLIFVRVERNSSFISGILKYNLNSLVCQFMGYP